MEHFHTFSCKLITHTFWDKTKKKKAYKLCNKIQYFALPAPVLYIVMC